MRPIKLLFVSLLCLTNLFAGEYFQQKVSYKINAELKPADHRLVFRSVMTYTNNSPDTLKEVYMRLHWNIFTKDSYGREKYNNVANSEVTDGVEIKSVKVNEQSVESYDVDNTIMKIPLEENLKPGDSVTIEIEAEETVPATSLRMGRYGRDYAIAHWFPAVCVYDKLGWQIDQYLGQGEFNEEIGNYEVNVTLPASYLVFYSGRLLNPNEVLPEEAIRNLDSAKTSDSRVRIYDQTLNPPARNDSVKKTWKFEADSVRTFAFAAFENRVWDAQAFNGAMINTVYPKDNETFYVDEGMKAAVQSVKFFSRRFGEYPYPNVFVVAIYNMGGGMEYPGITYVNASTPNELYYKINAMVIIHEIGHNWCPMTINSNETKYAFMDEGVTDYWTMKAVEEMYGKENNLINATGLLGSLLPPFDIYSYYYYQMVENQLTGLQEPILTHSDRYKSSYNYEINSYQKTECILSMLRYVMGEDAFAELFHEYFKRYRFKHVYSEDFVNLAEEINYKYNRKKDLSWFFNEWFVRSVILDYALYNINYRNEDGKYKTVITIKRVEDAIMPCDVVVHLANGTDTTAKFEAEDFLKGPASVSKTFIFDSKPESAVIDPELRLIDVNKLNNSTAILPPVSFHLNPLVSILKLPRPDEYTVYWIPAFSFNNVDGFKLGLNLQGTYFTGRKNFELTVTQGMKFVKGSTGGDLTLSDEFGFFGPLATGSLRYFNYEGRRGGNISFKKVFKSYNYAPVCNTSVSANYFDAYDDRYINPAAFDKILKPSPDSVRQRKYFWVNARFSYYNNNDWMSFNSSADFESGFVLLAGNRKDEFQKATFDLTERIWLPVIREIKLRQYIGYSPNTLPAAEGYYLATVNPIEEFSSYIYRTPGIISNSVRQKRSIPNGGGYMRGYYNQNNFADGITSFNSEISIGFLFKYIPIIGNILNKTTWFFADAGNVWNKTEKIRADKFLFDYGFSIKLPLRVNAIAYSGSNLFSFLTKLGINSINIDFPIYVSSPLPGEKKFKFRWLFGFQSPI